MPHKLERISEDEDIQLFLSHGMQELEDAIQSLNRSLIISNSAQAHRKKEQQTR